MQAYTASFTTSLVGGTIMQENPFAFNENNSIGSIEILDLNINKEMMESFSISLEEIKRGEVYDLDTAFDDDWED